jgi:hypothetical protein
MPSPWRRFINRFAPVGVLPQRRSTEPILRGLFEKYRGTSLEEELQRFGIAEEEVKRLFEAVDERYGAKILSGNQSEMNEAINAAFEFIAAGLVQSRRR